MKYPIHGSSKLNLYPEQRSSTPPFLQYGLCNKNNRKQKESEFSNLRGGFMLGHDWTCPVGSSSNAFQMDDVSARRFDWPLKRKDVGRWKKAETPASEPSEKFFVASLLLLFSSFISRLSFHSASISPLPLSCRYTERQPEEDYLNRFLHRWINQKAWGEKESTGTNIPSSLPHELQKLALYSRRATGACPHVWTGCKGDIVEPVSCRPVASFDWRRRRRRRLMAVLVGRVILDPREFRVPNADEPTST
jgi:hypothetical protein